MKRYIALLRGINISGKNKISMPELKAYCLALGFSRVGTYLNSGNVVFSEAVEDEDTLSHQISRMIKDRFHLEIPAFVVSQQALAEILEHAPVWWGNADKEIYDNLIFLMPPLSYEEFYAEIGEPKEECEKAQNYKNVVFWSFSRKDYQKTNWWAKTARANVGSKITIRTANTVRKLAIL